VRFDSQFSWEIVLGTAHLQFQRHFGSHIVFQLLFQLMDAYRLSYIGTWLIGHWHVAPVAHATALDIAALAVVDLSTNQTQDFPSPFPYHRSA